MSIIAPRNKKGAALPKAECEALAEHLLWRGRRYAGWTTQSEITQRIGLSGPTVRRVCQAYPELFVSSTEGYKHIDYASDHEIQHCVSTLIGRANRMLDRARALDYRLVA